MVGTHVNRTGIRTPVILQQCSEVYASVHFTALQPRVPRTKTEGVSPHNGPEQRKTVTLLTWLPREIVLFSPRPPARSRWDTLSPVLEPNSYQHPDGRCKRTVPHAGDRRNHL